MSLKFGKTIRTLSLSQNYLVLIKKKSVIKTSEVTSGGGKRINFNIHISIRYYKYYK